MKNDNWLKEALQKIEDMTPEEIVEKMREHHLVDSYTIRLGPEVTGLFDEDELFHLMTKLSKYAIEHNQIVIIGSKVNEDKISYNFSDVAYAELENKILTVAPGFGRVRPFEDVNWSHMAALYAPAPGEEIGHVNSNSRKKVVVSNSGFPYPVPQKSKKRK